MHYYILAYFTFLLSIFFLILFFYVLACLYLLASHSLPRVLSLLIIITNFIAFYSIFLLSKYILFQAHYFLNLVYCLSYHTSRYTVHRLLDMSVFSLLIHPLVSSRPAFTFLSLSCLVLSVSSHPFYPSFIHTSPSFCYGTFDCV